MSSFLDIMNYFAAELRSILKKIVVLMLAHPRCRADGIFSSIIKLWLD